MALLQVIDWNATAAMVQAVGSIVAIIASAGLAIFVPIWMRDREDRAQVQRSLNCLLYGNDEIVGSFQMTHDFLHGSQYLSATTLLLRERLASARAILGQINAGHLGPNAMEELQKTLLAAQTFDVLVEHLDRLGPKAGAYRMEDYEEVAEELRAGQRRFDALRPVKVQGLWLADTEDFARRANRGRLEPPTKS